MTDFAGIGFEKKALGFDHPTQLPRSREEHRRWQVANKAWWEATPMRYDWHEAIAPAPGSEAYFREIDRRFLAAARKVMPWREIPFDALIPFDGLGDKDVLEIGVGQGTHAQLLALHSGSFTGIDLTNAAAEMTSQRFRLLDIPGTVLQMDAECMMFADESFDFVWSWGVIHHTADTKHALAEIRRVLRPGGRCTIMVYYRSWWNYHVAGFLRSLFLKSGFGKSRLHKASQSGTDGTIARYYKPGEWRSATRGLFSLDSIRICGLKSDIVPLPQGRLKTYAMDLMPDSLARFLLRWLRMGSFLVVHMRKAA